MTSGWLRHYLFSRSVRPRTIVVKYINKKTVEQISMYYYGEVVNIMIYCYICKKKVNVVTCESIDFCSHMWLHWLLKIMFCSSFCVLCCHFTRFLIKVFACLYLTTMQILWARKYSIVFCSSLMLEKSSNHLSSTRDLKISLAFVMNKTPCSHFPLTVFTQCFWTACLEQKWRAYSNFLKSSFGV